MIQIKCETGDTRKLVQLIEFQGDLKKRTSKDLEALASSILEDGLIMPFVIWNSSEGAYLLDGHARKAALLTLVAQGQVDIIEQEFPVLVIKTESEEEARKQLLQISSQYGRIAKKGLVDFTKTIAEYRAPILSKLHKVANKPKKHSDNVVIRLSVARDKADSLRQLLSQTDGVKIL